MCLKRSAIIFRFTQNEQGTIQDKAIRHGREDSDTGMAVEFNIWWGWVLCGDYLDPADHDGGQWSSISYLSSDIQRNILQTQSAYRAEALVAIITIIPHNTPRAAATISSHPASDPSQGSQLK